MASKVYFSLTESHSNHLLQRSYTQTDQSINYQKYHVYFSLVITLTCDLLIAKSNQIITVSKCNKVVNLVKFPNWFIGRVQTPGYIPQKHVMLFR